GLVLGLDYTIKEKIKLMPAFSVAVDYFKLDVTIGNKWFAASPVIIGQGGKVYSGGGVFGKLPLGNFTPLLGLYYTTLDGFSPSIKILYTFNARKDLRDRTRKSQVD